MIDIREIRRNEILLLIKINIVILVQNENERE